LTLGGFKNPAKLCQRFAGRFVQMYVLSGRNAGLRCIAVVPASSR
jgi:hypothetical protein